MDYYLKPLKELIKFKTISTDSDYKEEIEKCVNWYQNLFEDNGFVVEIVRGYSNPIILAKYDNNSEQTALIYGHYDVQPAGNEKDWDSIPFELSERDNRLYARGIIDNKGQSFVHIATVLNLIKNEQLGQNVTFLLEGGEEIGSPGVANFLTDYKEKLSADYIVISDGTMIEDYPVLEVGLRGIMNLTVKVFTSDRELHSGLFGGAAPNASHELVNVLSKLYDDNKLVNMNGFYTGVEEPTEQELENNKTIPYSFEEFHKLSGTKKNISEDGVDFYTQTGLRPTVQITGIESGYNGEGYKSGIPNAAIVKLNIRLVASQDPIKVKESIVQFFSNNLAEYADFEIVHSDDEGSVPAVKIDTDNEYVQKAITILEEVYQKKVLRKYVGGTIPLVYHIEKILNIPQVIVPLVNPDSNMHSVNENYDLSYLKKALEFSNNLFKK